jgi:hypothetical protein
LGFSATVVVWVDGEGLLPCTAVCLAFKDYEEIVDKCCDAWNDILKKDNFVKKLCSREWIELV